MRPSETYAIIGGVAGTVLMTAIMYWVAPLLTGMPMDIARMLGDFFGIAAVGGLLVHFINGSIIFPLIYAFVLFPVLPGGPVLKGLTWGAVLWALSQSIVSPLTGGGFFSANAGGAMAVLGSLAGHLAYGGTLGAIAGGTETTAAAA